MQHLFNFVFMGAVLWWMTVVSYSWFHDIREPFIIHGAHLENTEIEYGELLIAVGNVTRNRECPTLTHRFISQNGNDIFRIVEPSVANRIGVNLRPRIAVHLPAHALPGEGYSYHSVAYTTCDGNKTHVSSPYAPLKFRIVKRQAAWQPDAPA